MNIRTIMALPVCAVPLTAEASAHLSVALKQLVDFLGAPGDWGYNTQLGLLAQLVHHIGHEAQAYGATPRDKCAGEGLSTEESAIAVQLAMIWNLWLRLPDRGTIDNQDFQDAINDAQKTIALRVARRVDPAFWKAQA